MTATTADRRSPALSVHEDPRVDVAALTDQLLGTYAPLRREARAVAGSPDFHKIEGGPRVTRGRVAAGDKDIQTAESRRKLADEVGAIAATWESSAIGRVCRFHDVPYLSIRVVTDLGKDEFLAEYRAGAARALLPAARALARLFMK